VRDVEASLRFYREVLGVTVDYADLDFAALKAGGTEFMLHADHTYDTHPWYESLLATPHRGLGAELRLMGHDADEVERRAKAAGAVVLRPSTTKGHGIREVMVEDPDGYVWAVGSLV
jgi:catechol 2,3-dioxygenase-like lactoylglutathione lyase family enzyme